MNKQIGERADQIDIQESNFTRLLWDHHEKKRVKETGILGYCGCCGRPYFVNKEIEHDKECIWYE